MKQTEPLPLVSIIVVNYNLSAYLASAIDCALAQTYPRLEVVVVDDGSTDSSRSIIERYQGRVKTVFKQNGGQSSAYNAGYEQSCGSIVFFLDGDDLLDSDAVAQVVPLFEPGVARVHFRLRIIDSQGRALGGTIPHLLSDNRAARSLVKSGYLYASSPASGNAFERGVLDLLMPIPVVPEDRGGGEFSLVYGAGLYGEIRAYGKVIASYRAHVPADDQGVVALVFGNSARSGDEAARRAQRAARFVASVYERSGGKIQLPTPLVEFSQAKEQFGIKALSATTYGGRIAAGLRGARAYFRALWLVPNASILYKSAATLWAIFVVVMPRSVSHRIGRYGANPATR